jgi:hypothetical protein
VPTTSHLVKRAMAGKGDYQIKEEEEEEEVSLSA